jgi:hypothetical protein
MEVIRIKKPALETASADGKDSKKSAGGTDSAPTKLELRQLNGMMMRKA